MSYEGRIVYCLWQNQKNDVIQSVGLCTSEMTATISLSIGHNLNTGKQLKEIMIEKSKIKTIQAVKFMGFEG